MVPARSIPVSASPSEPPPRIASGTVARRPRVLVVDDEPLVAESLRLVLSDEFTVVATTDPQQALARVGGGESFDVILCDVMMPLMTGPELRDRLDEVAPDQAARIVFITGGILLPHVRALLERVPNAWLEKPIDLDGLRDLIRRRVRSAAWLPARSGI
jgi:CheY-like chemotaxis protein